MKKIIAFCVVYILITVQVFTLGFYESDIQGEKIDDIKEVANSDLKINAKSAILFDRTCKRILYEKNAYEKLPNASTTKIMTAIIAYENGNLLDTVTVSKNAAIVGGSSLKLRTGDKIILGELVQGMLLCSGNDAAVAVAEHIGGTVENFCVMMNDKAKEIGAYNTNFVSPHGLDNENHYSSAYDLAIIADYALKIPKFAELAKQKVCNIKVNGYTRTVTTTNEMLSYYIGADGVKTGYTGDAGRCLVTSATRDGWQLISVVLGCGTKTNRTLDSAHLLDYGFSKFKFADLCENMKKSFRIIPQKAIRSEYIINISESFNYPIREEEKNYIKYVYEIDRNLRAPIAKGTNIGNISIYLKDDVVKTITLKTEEDIYRKSARQYMLELLRKYKSNLKLEF